MDNPTEINKNQLIIYKNINRTFEELVETIWISSGYGNIQCEQLAIQINLKGFTTIKIGDVDELIPMGDTIQLDGFKVKII